MLASLLSDIDSDTCDGQAIFVDANPDRFQYILDWYRYGEMLIPSQCSTDALLRDARFFMLPDYVKINRRMHCISPPAGPPQIHEQLRADVISKWPTFRQYVERLTSETAAKITDAGNISAKLEAPTKTYGPDYPFSAQYHHPDYTNSNLNPDDAVLWHEHSVAKCMEETHRIASLRLHCEYEVAEAMQSPENRFVASSSDVCG